MCYSIFSTIQIYVKKDFEKIVKLQNTVKQIAATIGKSNIRHKNLIYVFQILSDLAFDFHGAIATNTSIPLYISVLLLPVAVSLSAKLSFSTVTVIKSY